MCIFTLEFNKPTLYTEFCSRPIWGTAKTVAKGVSGHKGAKDERPYDMN